MAECDHDLDAEYLYPADGRILDIYEGEEGLTLAVAVACPECDQALRLEAPVADVTETQLEVPLGDETDQYD